MSPVSNERDIQKKEFSRRLQKLMLDRGWNQSEVARRARMGRDNISCYINARTLPELPQLNKLAKAFGVDPNDLLPGVIRQDVDLEIPLEIREIDEDRCYLRVAQTLTSEQAMEIMRVLKKKK